MNQSPKFKKWIVATSVLLAVVLAGIGSLYYLGILQFNYPDRNDYPLRGVDVSVYQGEIDWPLLVSQDVSFAFIKATEGSSLVDRNFANNWQGAVDAGLPVGAYHFFSYDSPGDTQADLFIQTVPVREGTLPPVVDLEFYADKEKNPPPREHVAPELDRLLARMEETYGQKPIIYATMKSYDLYLRGAYAEYPIWIREVVNSPRLSDGRDWTFWQYSNRGRLDGYSGEEPYIDLNVFFGSREDLERLLSREKEAPDA